MDEYLALIRQFNSVPTLCNWFQLFAYDTWRRIEFARNQRGLKIFETTITQNILYEFAVYRRIYPSLRIDMYESLNEAANGNDIEFEIIYWGRVLKLPMQAKIIYADGKYPRMKHGAQIESLIDYSIRESGYPLYVLYNYYDGINLNIFNNRTDCGITYGVQQYGISLVSAYHLRDNYYNQRVRADGSLDWEIPHFGDLHPTVAVPWFKLVCCGNINNPIHIVDMFEPPKSPNRAKLVDQLLFRPVKKIELEKWKPLSLEEFIGEKKQMEKYYTWEEHDGLAEREIVFAPKYKIIIIIGDQINS